MEDLHGVTNAQRRMMTTIRTLPVVPALERDRAVRVRMRDLRDLIRMNVRVVPQGGQGDLLHMLVDEYLAANRCPLG